MVDESLSKNSFNKKAAKSLFFTLLSSKFALVISFLSFFVLSALLSVEDFGVYAMLYSLVSIFSLFKDLGLKEATVQADEISEIQLSTLFWVQCFLGVVLFLTISLCSPLFLRFYNLEGGELNTLIFLLGFNILIQSLSLQHYALLLKNLEFKKIALLNISANGISLLIGIYFALNSQGYWALVYKLLSHTLILSLGYVVFSQWKPLFVFDLKGVQKFIKFGLNLFAGNIIQNVSSNNLSQIFIGKYLGVDFVGLFNRADTLLTLPSKSLNQSFKLVGLSTLKKLRDDPIKYERFYLTLMKVLSSMTIPIVLFIIFFTNSIIVNSIGEKWLSLAPIVKGLGLMGICKASSFAVPLLNITSLQPHKVRNIAIINLIVNLLTVLFFVRFGLIELVIALSVVRFIAKICFSIYSTNGTCVGFFKLLSTYTRPILFSIVSIVFFSLVSSVEYFSDKTQFYVATSAYFLIYAILLFIFENETIKTAYNLIMRKKL